ncbi:MAG: primosomal protein N' [Tissierellia bacterium]|nr:primosomal protein N' [Tissierellia bacterium]
MYVEVLINRNIDSLDKPFTYHVPVNLEESTRVGCRVIVPFGKANQPISGIITNLSQDGTPDFETKDIFRIVDKEPFIQDEELELADFISSQTFCNRMEAIKLFLPPGDMNSIEKILVPRENAPELFNKKDVLREHEWSKIDSDTIAHWMNEGRVSFCYRLDGKQTRYSKILYKVSSLTPTTQKLTQKQRDVYELVQQESLEKSEIMERLGISDTPIKNLEAKGLLCTERVYYKKTLQETERYKKHALNPAQQEVFDEILSADKNPFFLLHGVTGSGKTELYLQLVEKILNQGKNAIILVPEIGLTPQTVARFKGRFKEEIAIIHSQLTTKERFNEWIRIKNGDARIVVGARSAIFAPMKNIGIIVIDEEHDNSYISSKTPKYRTVDIAEFRARKNNAILLLGTATPGIETYWKSKTGEYKLLEISTRANNQPLPSVQLVDMAAELKNGNTSIFSLALYEALLRNLQEKKQSMLFLNRRGFSSFITCRSCGEAITCEHCDVSMTYHKKDNHLLCHYCGNIKKVPDECPICQSKKIKDFGVGTEQVETMVRQLFPQARVRRMDRDTTSKRGEHFKIWKDMNQGKIDILIGTQMITKGLDFKNVTLVGILAADMTLKLPDFRSAEWTFSMIQQVSGRAGRGTDPGKVILQTYQPDHFAIASSVKGDYLSFYSREISLRREFFYPPYSNIVLVRSLNQNNISAHNTLIRIYDEMCVYKKMEGLKSEMYHPNPAPLSKIKNTYRWQFMMKCEKEELERVLLKLKQLGGSDIQVDVDPINMM